MGPEHDEGQTVTAEALCRVKGWRPRGVFSARQMDRGVEWYGFIRQGDSWHRARIIEDREGDHVLMVDPSPVEPSPEQIEIHRPPPPHRG